MKDTKKNNFDKEIEINQKLASAFLSSEEYKKQNSDILYSVRCEHGKYYIKIYKDDENLLSSYLKKLEEET